MKNIKKNVRANRETCKNSCLRSVPCLLGGGMIDMIFSIWFSVDVPGNNGLPKNIIRQKITII